MSMGPFTVQKAKSGMYAVVDLWNDPAALVDTEEHARDWIKLFYQTLEITDQFLNTRSQRNALALRGTNEAVKKEAKTNGGRGKYQRQRKKGIHKVRGKANMLELSCGAVVSVAA